jgi:hypothetical protein
MTKAGLSPESLGNQASVASNGIRSFLAGERWPNAASRTKIERALGWPTGRIEDIALGNETDGLPPAEPADAPEPEGRTVELTVNGGTRIKVWLSKDYTDEQVIAMGPAILAATLRGIADATSGASQSVTADPVGNPGDS